MPTYRKVPGDGDYQVSVKVGVHFEFVDYKVVDGKAQPK